MSTNNYAIELSGYVERHYISKFKKKYKGAWDITWKALEEEFKRIETLIGVNTFVETIYDCTEFIICKTEFRIAGTQQSRHSSGNRCILAVHKNVGVVCVLLVYSKSDVKSSHETVWWQSLIKENYKKYAHCF